MDFMANIDDTSLVGILRSLVAQTVESTNPTDILQGTVVSVKPLSINVEQRFTLTEEFLILTKNVKDYKVNVSIDWITENTELNASHSHSVDGISTESSTFDTNHNHSLIGTKQITIHNGLKVGEKVILLRNQGGQKYIVLDKVV